MSLSYSDAIAKVQNWANLLPDLQLLREVLELAASGVGQAETLKRAIADLQGQLGTLTDQRTSLAAQLDDLQSVYDAKVRTLEAAQAARVADADTLYREHTADLQREHEALVARLESEILSLDGQRNQAQAAASAQQAELARVTQATEDARRVLRQLAAAG